jgi:RHS repeat-associated protein
VQTVALAYDDASRRTSLTLPNGITAAYGYDAASRLTSIAYSRSGSPMGDLAYGYDGDGNRTRASGSLARQTLPEAVSQASYDDANRLTSWNGLPLLSDRSGNLVQHGLTSYVWNARGELASLAGPGTLASFRYDAFGRRSEQTVNAQTSGYRYDGDQAVQELTGSPPAPSANLLTGLALDEVFARSDSAGTSSFVTDALGSTLALADANGTLQTEYTYEPFGKTTQTGSASANAVQFTGREQDATGLYYYRARYYSPQLQRFLSEDPLEFAAGDTNLYAYVGNSPTNFTDPSGLCGLPCAIGLGFAAYDAYKLATGGRKDAAGNALNLALGLTPFGMVTRGLRAAKAAPRALPAARQVDAAWGSLHQYAHGPGPMTAIEHINYRHAFNSGFDNVSRFAQGTTTRQIQSYVDDALRYGNVTQSGASIQYDVGRVIGYDQAGNAVTGIQVWVRNGYIRTAFPVAP